MNSTRSIMAAAVATLALSLGGCWDDDEDNTVLPVVPAAVPASAGATAAAFISYLPTLSGTDESSEPLTIGDSFAVPADDSSEPAPVT